jgi:ribosomal protein S18 acetylase RimI-like enzyme
MAGAEIRLARAQDAERIGRLLHDFNAEYDEPTPGPEALAERVSELMEVGEVTVLLAGPEPHGLALLRFRPWLWKRALEAYLEELYVVPDRRGQGSGRALMEAVIDLSRERGAAYISLGTGDDDTAARGLYESLGFTNLERQPDGPVMYFYEREL